MTDATSGDEAKLAELKATLAAKENELEEMRAAMPAHTIRVHQQMALEEAEDEVRDLREEITRLEATRG